MKNIHKVDLSFDKSKENNYLSNTLLTKIKESLEKKEKAIIYINKRGNFSSLVCQDCNYIFMCENCDISLNIHKYPEKLVCHHCFKEDKITNICKNCNGVNLKKVGVGTEQIESTIKNIFPKASIYRFDTDNLRNVGSKKQALQMLDETDIIIGTKMITTGFNIKKVGVIGVILIEQELNIPRYNTEESVYSNLRQLIGRGGRVGQKTDIILQTYAMNNPMIKNIAEKNYKEFFLSCLEERKLFNYPPFTELVYISYKHKEKEKSINFINKFYTKLLANIDKNIEVILVDKPLKRNNQFFTKIIIKGKNVRSFLESHRKEILTNSNLNVIFEN